jgi:uncharacterized protein YkwD
VHTRRTLSTLLATLALAGGSLLAAAPPAAAGTGGAEWRLLERVNAVRADHGLRPLRMRDGLRAYAGGHSTRMTAARTLFHTPNFGVICCWSAIAENVAYGYSVRQVHQMFMGSPGHRANILDARMRGVGIGIVRRGDQLWVTQVFRAPD